MNHWLKTLTLVLLVAGIVACTRMTPEETYAEAQRLMQEQEYAEAAILAKQLISDAPRDPAYRVLMARLNMHARNLDAADKEYARAAEYGIDLSEISREQVDLELIRNNYDYAYELLLERQRFFADTQEWNALVATVALVKNDAELLESALVELGSEHAEFISAARLVNDRKLEEAARLLLGAQQELYAPELLFIIGSSLVEAQEHELAQATLEKYTSARPENRIANYFLARSYLATGDMPEARTQIDIVRSGNTKNALGQYVEAVYQFQSGNLDEAASYATASIEAGLNNPSNHFIVGVHSFQNENFERALSSFQYLNANYPQIPVVQRLLGVTQLRLGDVTSATDSIAQISDPTQEDMDLILLTGFKAIQSSQSDQVLSELTRFARNVEVDDIDDALGFALLSYADDTEAGIRQLEITQQTNPKSLNAFAILATAYVQMGELDKARSLIESFLEGQEELTIDTREVLANVYLQLGQIDKASAEFSRIAQAEPERPSVMMYAVVEAEASKDFEAALAAIQRYVETHPNNIKGFIKYNDLLNTMNAGPDAFDTMFASLAAVNIPEHQILFAEMLIADKKLSRSKSVLQGIESAAIQSRVNTMLGFIAMEEGDADTAMDLAMSVLNEAPNDIKALQVALRANATKQDFLANSELINKALLVDPSNPAIIYLDALNASFDKKFDKAQTQLDKIARNNDQIALRSLQGKIHLGKGEYEKAYPYLLEAYSVSATRSRLMDIVKVTNKLGKLEERNEIVDAYVNNVPDDIGIQLMRIEYILADDVSAGAQALEGFLQQFPNNEIALNNLSWAYLQLGELDKSAAAIDQALAKAPDFVPFIHQKAQVLMAQQQGEQALQILEPHINLESKQPGKYEFAYLNFLVDLGKTDVAQFYYEQMVNNGVVAAEMNQLKSRLSTR